MRLLILGYLFFIAGFLQSQTEFPYKIQLLPYSINEFDGLHSFVYGQHNGYWCLIGGRTDGIHARQPFNAFPAEHNNQSIYVIKPDDKKVWSVQEISRLKPWEYEKVEKEIDRAVREGRVVDSVE